MCAADLARDAQLRRATADDLPALRRLEALCFDDAWSEASLAAELVAPHGRTWLCLSGGQVVGSLMAWHLFEDLEINRVAVDPCQRGRGLAALLVHQVLAEGAQSGAQRALLEVRADNTAALALYAKTGFSVHGRRKGYYHDGMDALLLVRAVGIHLTT